MTEPGLAAEVVTETMHLHPVMPPQVRLPQYEVEVEGVTLQPGEALGLNLAAAGRDPVEFDEADAFRFGREARYEIAFAYGAHFCLGN